MLYSEMFPCQISCDDWPLPYLVFFPGLLNGTPLLQLFSPESGPGFPERRLVYGSDRQGQVEGILRIDVYFDLGDVYNESPMYVDQSSL